MARVGGTVLLRSRELLGHGTFVVDDDVVVNRLVTDCERIVHPIRGLLLTNPLLLLTIPQSYTSNQILPTYISRCRLECVSVSFSRSLIINFFMLDMLNDQVNSAKRIYKYGHIWQSGALC